MKMLKLPSLGAKDQLRRSTITMDEMVDFCEERLGAEKMPSPVSQSLPTKPFALKGAVAFDLK